MSPELRPDASSGKKIGLVLGSGGARGIAHFSALARLESLGIRPNLIAGASAGAIAGAVYASGTLSKMMERLRSLTWKDLVGLADPANPRQGFFEGKKALKFLAEFIPERARIEELSIPLAVVATDLASGDTVVFREGNVLETLRASMSVPGVFTPVEIGGKFLIDGGIADPLPIDIAQGMGATVTIAVNPFHIIRDRRHVEIPKKGLLNKWLNRPEPSEKPLPQSPTITETLLQTIDIMERIGAIRMIESHKPDILICPDVFDIGILEFHRAAEALAAGEKACDAVEGELKKLAAT